MISQAPAIAMYWCREHDTWAYRRKMRCRQSSMIISGQRTQFVFTLPSITQLMTEETNGLTHTDMSPLIQNQTVPPACC